MNEAERSRIRLRTSYLDPRDEVDRQCFYISSSIENLHVNEHPESLLRNIGRIFSIESPFSEEGQTAKFHGSQIAIPF